MNAVSNARQKKDAGPGDERRGGAQRTVAPARTRVRATSRDTRRSKHQGTSGPVATGDDGKTGKPLWEDDGGPLPPEEWS
ncbi:hypothetical protein [Burkholderia catarinensis]|uniref:hypothetical protein n=1 Tax=Burkholderia catarinensis TaxID=1108140 RepID=UPI00091C2583|nr:hypothetical protein [Burkholderia catarinensis]KAG8152435.1 hypothetical protein BFF94_017055 [Burkholderia catarinensis]